MNLHVYPQHDEIKSDFTKKALDLFQSLFKNHSDNLLNYSVYNTVEETIRNYSIYDYYNMFTRAGKDQGIDYLKTNNVIEVPKLLLEYSNQKLKELFSNEDVVVVTKFVIDRLKNHYMEGILVSNKPEYDKKYGKYYNERLYINIINESYKKELEWKKNCEYEGVDKDIETIENNVKATGIIYSLLKNPDEKNEIWDFIINKICRSKRSDLIEIMRRYGNNFNDKRGRPSNNLKVYKFDAKTLEVLTVYESRKECMEKEGIGKTFLSMLISGKKASYKKCTFGEMTEEKFKELQAIDNM